MKNTIKILSLICVAATILSCQEDKLLTYDSESNIFFRQKKWTASSSQYYIYMTHDGKTMSSVTKANVNGVIDSVRLSMAFVNDALRSDTTFLPVTVMGDIYPERRDIKFEILDVGDKRKAVEGVDFRILDAYIPANKRDGGIVIEMFRENFVQDQYKTIDFQLLPNEHFETNYKWINQSSTDTTKVSTLTMKLCFTDGLAEPRNWSSAVSFWGKFSVKKVYVMVYELGMTWEYLYEYNAADDISGFRFIAAAYGNALKKWLKKYEEDNGTPYLEDDDTPMESGTSSTL